MVKPKSGDVQPIVCLARVTGLPCLSNWKIIWKTAFKWKTPHIRRTLGDSLDSDGKSEKTNRLSWNFHWCVCPLEMILLVRYKIKQKISFIEINMKPCKWRTKVTSQRFGQNNHIHRLLFYTYVDSSLEANFFRMNAFIVSSILSSSFTEFESQHFSGEGLKPLTHWNITSIPALSFVIVSTDKKREKCLPARAVIAQLGYKSSCRS